jgi:energy-coupling factor transport system substrate-specific component
MNYRWRTVDIVVASVLGVAFGVVFWAWYLLYSGPAEVFPLPGRAILYGVWLVPAVLGALVIRKPGAAVYTELIAAIVSALLGNSWGVSVIPQGLLEGLGAELVRRRALPPGSSTRSSGTRVTTGSASNSPTSRSRR